MNNFAPRKAITDMLMVAALLQLDLISKVVMASLWYFWRYPGENVWLSKTQCDVYLIKNSRIVADTIQSLSISRRREACVCS